MKLQNKNIVITGAADGIGYALANRINQESPNSLSLIDINESVVSVANSLHADSYTVDVSDQNAFQEVLNQIIDKNKSIDLFVQMLVFNNLEPQKLQLMIGKKIGTLT